MRIALKDLVGFDVEGENIDGQYSTCELPSIILMRAREESVANVGRKCNGKPFDWVQKVCRNEKNCAQSQAFAQGCVYAMDGGANVACKSCTLKRKICIRYVNPKDQLVVLPLHQRFRVGASPADPDYWVMSARMHNVHYRLSRRIFVQKSELVGKHWKNYWAGSHPNKDALIRIRHGASTKAKEERAMDKAESVTEAMGLEG